jgi:hypothetical protein
VNASQQRPRPDYITALENVTEVLSLMIGDKWTERAARLTGSFAAWTRAVNSRDQMAILNAAEAFGNDIQSVRTEMEQEKADAQNEQADRAGGAAGDPNAPPDQKAEELWSLYDMKFEGCEWDSMAESDEPGTAVPMNDWEQGFDNERQLAVARQIMSEQPIILPAVQPSQPLHDRAAQKKAPSKKAPPLTANSPTVKAALDKHKQDTAALFNMLQAGKGQPNTSFGIAWSNACEWLLSGRTVVHALTRTHDASTRATAMGQKGNIAYFGASDAIPNAGDYDFNTPTSGRNINLSGQNVAGWQSGAEVAIMEPAGKPLSSIQDFVVHETLHASDGNQPNVQSGYETEFDAYWLSGRFDSTPAYPGTGVGKVVNVVFAGPPPQTGTATGFQNARQAAIFQFLANSPTYAYVGQSWINDAAFRTFVLRHTQPTGTNPVNSTRLEDLRAQVVARDVNKAWVAFFNLKDSDKDAMRSPAARYEWIDLLDQWDPHGIDMMRRLGLQQPMAPMIRNFHSVLSTRPFVYSDAVGAFAMLSESDKAEIRGPLKAQFVTLIKSLPSPHDFEFAGKFGF